jgi:hypothetical protein
MFSFYHSADEGCKSKMKFTYTKTNWFFAHLSLYFATVAAAVVSLHCYLSAAFSGRFFVGDGLE